MVIGRHRVGFWIRRALALAVISAAFVASRSPTQPDEPSSPRVRPCPLRLSVDAPPSADPWRDPNWLRPQFKRACEAVEWACRTRYQTRPKVRSATDAEFALALAECSKRRNARDPLYKVRAVSHYKGWADTMIGIYLQELDTVLLSPTAMKHTAKSVNESKLLDPDLLQLALVHEAVHALDYERFPHWEDVCTMRKGEADRAFDALLEGHAQHVTRRVAVAWGMQDTWKRMLSIWDAKPDETDPLEYTQDAHRPGAWKYVCGQRCVDWIYRELGEKGLQALLENPPEDPYVINVPGVWVENYREGTFKRWVPPVDLDAIPFPDDD